jgi:hypothetical protein
MTMTSSTLPGAEHTLFRGYGPFVALVALIVAMALLAPTVAPERDVTTPRRPADGNLRSLVTGGVAQERRNERSSAVAELRRSFVTDGVADER